MAALTGVGSGIHGNNAAWAEEVYNVFMEWWEKHGAFRPDWSPKQASEVAFVAAIAFMEKKFTSTNTASLKLPPFKNIWNEYCEHLMNRVRKRPEAGSIQAAEFIYEFIVRQLQA